MGGSCSKMDDSVVSLHQQNGSNPNSHLSSTSTPGGRRGSRLERVGSRRTPFSPFRASNYGHVHDAVNRNFSAVTGFPNGQPDSGVPLGVVGLRNLGNTCFLNSSLQCLSATIPLTDYFLGYDYKKELNQLNCLGTQGKLAIAYAELMKAMWLGRSQLDNQNLKRPTTRRGGSDGKNNKHSGNSITILRPTSFKSALETFAPQFAGVNQHDAQELLSFLLDGIHEDLNRINNKPYIEDPDFDGTNDEQDATTAWRNYLQRDKSLIVDIFQGQVKNTRQCCVCQHVSVRFEPFMYLSVPISDECRTINDCVNLYLQEELLSGENQWYCSKCKSHRDAIQKSTIWVMPPILIVHLKRFRFNEYGRIGSKNNAVVNYPFSWDMRHLTPRLVSCTYDLYAISNHIGGMGSGHYTAYCKNRFNDEWFELNDSDCRRVSEQTLEQNRSSAYLLFYNRIESPNGGLHDLEPKSPSSLPARAPLIRRQSVSRPDLWPHAQVLNNQYRDFVRQSAKASGTQDSSPLYTLVRVGDSSAIQS